MKVIILFIIFNLLIGCNNIKPNEELVNSGKNMDFKVDAAKESKFTSPEAVEILSNDISDDYLIGPGDVLILNVWNRADVSKEDIIVGPDGIINIIRIGIIHVNGRTRVDVQNEISEKLAKFYVGPEVTLEIKEYTNNRAFVLGRVSKPGIVKFPGQGTLLEALSLAGGLPILDDAKAPLTQCAILRGKDKIIWIDLKDLLNNGNMLLNARIKNNDVIFIPESGESEYVYVMGEAKKTGVVKLTSQLTVLDALMQVGGVSKDANTKKIYLIRLGVEGQSQAREVNLKNMLETGDIRQNYVLNSKDVIFVSEKGISSWNYIMNNIMPTLEVLDLGNSVLNGTISLDDVKVK